ncbi:hypothetical protein EGW08_017464, partial [Elysia chlorotica]
DIDECATAPCEEDQYCSNTQGSYTCFSCDEACESCTGSGPKKCRECRGGFTRAEDSTECVDDNECDTDTSLCNGENEMCKNTPGSYECACQTGFSRRDEACVPSPKERVTSERKLETPPNLKDQLQRQLDQRRSLDWSKYRDNPSVLAHFLAMAAYGLSCHLARGSR